MRKFTRISLTPVLLWALIATEALAVEIVYTGDNCECSKQLQYQISARPTAKVKSYAPKVYQYKLDVPISDQPKVTTRHDFHVQQPVTTKPPKPKPLYYNAKIDRITVNRKDCVADAASDHCAPVKIHDNLYSGSRGPHKRHIELKSQSLKKRFHKLGRKVSKSKILSQFHPNNVRRNKRDIKGEYGAVEKRNIPINLIIPPEVVQYMPEILGLNFNGDLTSSPCLCYQKHVHNNGTVLYNYYASNRVDALSRHAKRSFMDNKAISLAEYFRMPDFMMKPWQQLEMWQW